MSRVKRGLTAHARHKKILDMAKAIEVVIKMYSELLLKKLKKVCNMLTVTEKQRKEVSALCGFNVSTLLHVSMI